MQKRFTLVFDEVILKQLKKLGQDVNLRSLLTKMFDRLEELGPRAGKLIDSKLALYEVKAKSPPLRLYFRHSQNEIQIFQYDLKTSEKRQKKTIEKLKGKLRSQDQRE